MAEHNKFRSPAPFERDCLNKSHSDPVSPSAAIKLPGRPPVAVQRTNSHRRCASLQDISMATCESQENDDCNGRYNFPAWASRRNASSKNDGSKSHHSRSKSLISSPPQVIHEGSEGEKEDESKGKHPIFGDLFNGTSAPVNLGILPSTQKESPQTSSRPPDAPRLHHRRNSTATTVSKPFSWFGPKASANPPKSNVEEAKDPLLSLDTHAALFPHGPVDPLDPSSFNDLLSNAEACILRLQAAYREKSGALRDLRAEREAEEEEYEEAETRSRHLKVQLDEMAAKVLEQEREMKAVADELARERSLREQEEQARKRSVLLVRKPDSLNIAIERAPTSRSAASVGSASSTIDSGFESGEEESFSECASSPSPQAADGFRNLPDGRAVVLDRLPPSLVKRPSTFHKVLEDISAETERSPTAEDRRGDSIVSGRTRPGAVFSMDSTSSASSDLRQENKQLRVRVGELESAIEGCLDTVTGVWR